MDGQGEPGRSQSRAGVVARRFGRYTLIKKLATGGMAEIWLATHKGVADFVRFVVIKKILPHLAEQPAFVRMFLDEARTSALLNHPNIVQIYDLGEESGAYFIAMEYVAGENLATLATRAVEVNEVVPPLLSARIVAEAARALHYAHELRAPSGQHLGLVHRDVSPQNVLVTYEGEVKVVDFGIAKAASRSEHTATGMLKGKFSYMSPEQARGLVVDRRSDVFSLGIVLYELVTGRRLFKHDSELMILELVTRHEIPRPSSLRPGLPEDLEVVLLRALERSPEARYQTAQELQLALDACVRRSASPVGSAELAGLMRRLFEGSIAEKRALCEAAARGALPIASAPPAPRAAPRAPLPPQATPLPPPRGASIATVAGSLAPAGLPETRTLEQPSLPPEPGLARSYAGPAPAGHGRSYVGPGPTQGPRAAERPSYVGPGPTPHTEPRLFADVSSPGYAVPLAPPRPRRWLEWAGVAAVLLTIGGALAVLVPMALRPPTQAALRRGSVAVSTRPEGARVLVEGRPFVDATGAELRTPLELSQLDLGATFRLRLEKDGFEPLEHTFVMSEEMNKRTLVLALEPAPSADEPAPASPTVRGVARTSAEPAAKVDRTAKVDPAAKVEPAVRSKAGLATKPDAARPEPKRGCLPTPGLPDGFVTVSSEPYADVYAAGRLVGQTPLPKLRLPAGCAELRLVNPESKRERTIEVDVQPSTTSVYAVEL